MIFVQYVSNIILMDLMSFSKFSKSGILGKISKKINAYLLQGVNKICSGKINKNPTLTIVVVPNKYTIKQLLTLAYLFNCSSIIKTNNAFSVYYSDHFNEFLASECMCLTYSKIMQNFKKDASHFLKDLKGLSFSEVLPIIEGL